MIVPVNLKITLGDDNQLKQIYAKLDVDYGTTMMGASVFANPSYSYNQSTSGNFFSGKKSETRREFQKLEIFYNPTGNQAENKKFISVEPMKNIERNQNDYGC